MKKIILSVALLAFAGAAAKANITNNTHAEYAVQDTVTKDPIKVEDLPVAVKTALKGETYKDWQPVSALFVKEAKREYYQVDLKKLDEIQVVKLDKDGKPLL